MNGNRHQETGEPPASVRESTAAIWPVVRKPQEGLVLIVDHLAGNQEALLPEELPYTQEMTPGRLREFRAGRCLARRALKELGWRPTALTQGTEGEPIWPDGIVGSLSHTSHLVAALVSRQGTFQSVGVDLNDHRPLGDAAAAEMMSDAEVAVAGRLGSHADLEAARNLVFSAKEALFKCQFPLTQCSDLDFSEVVLNAGAGDAFMSAEVVNRPEVAAVVRSARIFPLQIQGVIAAIALIP